VSARHRLARPVRRALHAGASRWPRFRRVVEVGARELDRALRDDWYEGAYFGERRVAAGDAGPVGYDHYTRDSSNADVAAYLLWRAFPVSRALDVGCAVGFVVEALRELGIDADGVDVSQFAIDHAALGARGHVAYGNLRYRLPFRDGAYELVTALETLEHLPPSEVPHALAELRRVTSAYVVATIPSFGPNEHGPGGWLNAKVPEERLAHYQSLGDDYDGPVPYDDLLRDTSGQPIEGHLTIASFRWWTARFEEAGFVRVGEVERALHPQLARFGLTKYWNLYVLRIPDAPVPAFDLRSDVECKEVERRFGLEHRVADPEDVARVREALGTDVFTGVPMSVAPQQP
jgi:SAM-dependent methyltransferase